MNREEYLKELKRYLKRLPADDYQNAMDYFTEYFDEAGPAGEQEVMAELGSPKEAAAELLSGLLDKKLDAENTTRKHSPFSLLSTIVLTLCAAPVAAPMALALLALLFAGLLVLACGILCVFLFSLSFAAIGMITIGKGVTALPLSVLPVNRRRTADDRICHFAVICRHLHLSLDLRRSSKEYSAKNQKKNRRKTTCVNGQKDFCCLPSYSASPEAFY